MVSGSRIFVNHDPESRLPRRSTSSTRFVCLSDTHSRTFVVPPGDVLLHSGDLCRWGEVSQLKKAVDWLASLPHPVKILIAGNHDLCLDKAWADVFGEKNLRVAQALLRGPAARAAGIYYLEHESVEFTTSHGHRWKVYGSPASPVHSEGAFQYRRGAGKELYKRIPKDTDILLTHSPPYQVHDLTRRGEHAGCKDLAERLQQLELDTIKSPLSGAPDMSDNGYPKDISWNCKLHVFGHIHEAYGASVKTGVNGECVQVNAAVASSSKPIVVDIPVKQAHDTKMDC